MSLKLASGIMIIASVLSGCAGSHLVTLGDAMPKKKITTAALAPQDGNSYEMDAHVQKQLTDYGIKVKPLLPGGTKRSDDVDVIVTYRGDWPVDIVRYLSSLTIELSDGPSGALLATGLWKNSFFHGYPDEQEVVKEVMDDMYAKLSAK